MHHSSFLKKYLNSPCPPIHETKKELVNRNLIWGVQPCLVRPDNFFEWKFDWEVLAIGDFKNAKLTCPSDSKNFIDMDRCKIARNAKGFKRRLAVASINATLKPKSIYSASAHPGGIFLFPRPPLCHEERTFFTLPPMSTIKIIHIIAISRQNQVDACQLIWSIAPICAF